MASPQDYPSIEDLEEWLRAAIAQVEDLIKQTPQERRAYRNRLLARLIAYEEERDWVMSSPVLIHQYMTEQPPLLPLGPTDLPWRAHFLLANAAYAMLRSKADAFCWVRDVRDFLARMAANALLPMSQCTKARELLQHLANHTIPEPLAYRISSDTWEAEVWHDLVFVTYKRVHTDVRRLWDSKPSYNDRIEALRRAYPMLSREDCEQNGMFRPHEVAKAVVGRMFDRSSSLINQVVSRASSRHKKDRLS